jgi:hypothetical protein
MARPLWAQLVVADGDIPIAKLAAAPLLADGTTAATGALDMGSQLISNVANPVSDNDAANKTWVEQQVTQGRTWKEVLLCNQQLISGDGVASAIAIVLTANPAVSDDIEFEDGTVTETYVFKAAEAVAFDVDQSAGTAAAAQTALAAAINADSAEYSAVETAELESIAASVLLVWRKDAAVTSVETRCFSNVEVNDAIDIVNFFGEYDYSKKALTALPTSDPATRNFGFERLKSALTVGESHAVRLQDYVYAWDEDDDIWNQTTTSGVYTGGDGVAITGNSIAVDLHATTPCLEFDGGKIRAKLDTTAGLVAHADGVQVNVGDGIKFTTGAVTVDLHATPGLEFNGGALRVKADGTSTQLAAGGVQACRPSYDDINQDTNTIAGSLEAQDTGITITAAPIGDVSVEVNGISYVVAQNDTERLTADFFFGTVSTTALAFNSITAAAKLYVNTDNNHAMTNGTHKMSIRYNRLP